MQHFEAAAMPCSRRQQYRESAVLRRCETVNAVQRAAIYFRLWQRWLHIVPQPTVVYLYFLWCCGRPTPYEKTVIPVFCSYFHGKMKLLILLGPRVS